LAVPPLPFIHTHGFVEAIGDHVRSDSVKEPLSSRGSHRPEGDKRLQLEHIGQVMRHPLA
jgi:hypothetical protein